MGAGTPSTVVPLKRKWFGPSTAGLVFPLILLWVLPEKYGFFVWMQAMASLFFWFYERTGRRLPRNERIMSYVVYGVFFVVSPEKFASYLFAFMFTFIIMVIKNYPSLRTLCDDVAKTFAEIAGTSQE